MPIPLVIETTLPIVISEPIRLALFIVSMAFKFGEMNLTMKIRIINRGFGSLLI